jgi:hypothetical protein
MTWHPNMPLEFRNQIITGDARERVRMTQPPLFVVQPEQLELAIRNRFEKR